MERDIIQLIDRTFKPKHGPRKTLLQEIFVDEKFGSQCRTRLYEGGEKTREELEGKVGPLNEMTELVSLKTGNLVCAGLTGGGVLFGPKKGCKHTELTGHRDGRDQTFYLECPKAEIIAAIKEATEID